MYWGGGERTGACFQDPHACSALEHIPKGNNRKLRAAAESETVHCLRELRKRDGKMAQRAGAQAWYESAPSSMLAPHDFSQHC